MVTYVYVCGKCAKMLNICMAPPYGQNLFHPKLPLSQRSPVSIPLVLSWPDVCSPAVLRWLKGTDGTSLCGMCAHSNTQNTHTCAGYGGGTGWSGDLGLLSQNLKMSFSSLPFARSCTTASIWNRCPDLTCDWRQTWTVVKRSQEFGCFFSAVIGLVFLFCASD